MKFLKENITTILIIGLAVLLTWQIRGCVGGNNEAYKAKLELNDSLRAIDKRQIEADKIQLAIKDTAIAQLQQQTLSILSNVDKHQVVYKPIYEQLKNIPIRISSISGNDAAIKAAFSKREED